MATRDPRYRPSSTAPLPVVVPYARDVADDRGRRHAHLATHPGCQFQHKGVRCVAGADEVVLLAERDELRSVCTGHVAPAVFGGRARVL